MIVDDMLSACNYFGITPASLISLGLNSLDFTKNILSDSKLRFLY